MNPRRYLILQTAFLGDVVLALPIAQALRAHDPEGIIGAVTVPGAAPLVAAHADIALVLPYDKRGKDKGVSGLFRCASVVRSHSFSVAIIPHRSLRSALLARIAGIPRRIGFDSSAGSLLFTDVVKYRHDAHEIDRDLDLLVPLGCRPTHRVLPILPANAKAAESVVGMSVTALPGLEGRVIAIAPGSVWATKRWTEEGFVGLSIALLDRGDRVLLVGGCGDRELCNRISLATGGRAISLAGKCSILESTEVLRRCDLLVTNDSAPQHLAVAVGTPVVAVFGPTVPAFGFAPAGPHDRVVGRTGLICRPCAIHGGPRCPIGTFECMKSIAPSAVLEVVDGVLTESGRGDNV